MLRGVPDIIGSDLLTAAEMVDAVLQLVPLDVEYEAHPIEYMVPDADSGVVLTENKVWDDTIAAVVKHGYDAKCVGQIERTKFYEKAAKAYVTICTSERLPYGCIILQKGVM